MLTCCSYVVLGLENDEAACLWAKKLIRLSVVFDFLFVTPVLSQWADDVLLSFSPDMFRLCFWFLNHFCSADEERKDEFRSPFDGVLIR